MVSEQPLSTEPPIQVTIMSSSSDQSPHFTLNTQPPSALAKPLIALNIIAQINEKLTPSTFPQWRSQFEALLIGYTYSTMSKAPFGVPLQMVPLLKSCLRPTGSDRINLS